MGEGGCILHPCSALDLSQDPVISPRDAKIITKQESRSPGLGEEAEGEGDARCICAWPAGLWEVLVLTSVPWEEKEDGSTQASLSVQGACACSQLGGPRACS